MFTKIWRMPIAPFVAVGVLMVYSLPLRAVTAAKSVTNPQDPDCPRGDCPDLGISGGALAALLLENGGAVAGVLYPTNKPATTKYQSIAFKKDGANTIKLTMKGTDGGGKPTRTEWTAKVDAMSRTITLTMNGTDVRRKPTRSEWTGKVDGRFYPVTGDPTSDELSFTNSDGRTITFTAKKAGKITETGQIVGSANGRSFTMTTNRVDSTGRQVSSEAVYEMR